MALGNRDDDLIVRIAAEIGGLRKDLETVKREVDGASRQMTGSLKGLDRQFGNVNRGLGAAAVAARGLIAALGVREIAAFTGQTLQMADAVAKTADSVGVSTGALQGWRYAVGFAGVASQELDRGLLQLNRRIGETAAGTGEARLTFQALGIEVKDANGQVKATEQVFLEVADRIAAIESPAQQAAAASKLFGEELGGRMVNALRNGGDGLQRLSREAQALGLVWDEKLLRQTEALNDEMSRLGQIVGTNFRGGLLEGFVTNMGDFRDVVADPNFVTGVRAIGEAIGWVATYSAQAVGNLGQLINTLSDPSIDRFLEFGKAYWDFATFGLFKDAAEDAGAGADALGDAAEGAGKRVKGLTFSIGEGNKELENARKAYAKSISAIQEEADELRERVKLFGQSEEAIQAHLDTQRLYSEAMAAQIDLDQDARAQIAALLAARQKAAGELRKLTEAEKAAAKATEEARRAQERQREEMERLASKPFENALQGIQASFTDFFESLFSGGVDSFSDLASAAKKIMIRLAAELATLQFIGPQGLNITGLLSGAGGLANAGAAGGGAGGLGNILSIGRMFTNAGSGFLTGFGNIGANFAAGGLSGAMFGLAGGGAAAAGVAPVAGGLTNAASAGLFGSGGALTGAGALGLGGLAIGAIMLASQLFKKKPSDFTASFQGMLGEDFIKSEDKANPETRQMRDQIQGAVESSMQAVLTGFGLDTPGSTYLDVAAGTRDQLRFWLYDTMESYAGQPASVRSDPIASGQFGTVEELVAGVLEAVIARAGTKGLTEALRAVAENADFSDLEEALADIEFAKVYDQLGQTVKATAEADTAIAEINSRFDELTEFAERFGLAVDKVDAGRVDAFADLATGFTQGLRDEILALTDPAQLAVRELEAWRDAQIRNANAIAQANGLAGASTEDLALIAELFGLRMQEVAGGVGEALEYISAAQASSFNEQLRSVQTYLGEVERSNAVWKRLSDQLRSTRQGLLTDENLSPLSPQLRREEAKRQFDDVAARAALGDQDAIADLPDISRQYLEASRAYYASSEAYFSDFQRVQQVLADTEALTGRHLSIGDQQLAAARDQVEKLTALINGDQLIVSSIEQANSLLAGIYAQLQAAGVPGAGGSGSGTGSLGTGVSYVDTGYQRSTDDIINGLTRTELDRVRASVGLTTAGGGVIQAQIAQDPDLAQRYRDAILAAGGVPSFARGGIHRGGLRLVGESGPELEFTPPSRIFSAAETQRMMSGTGAPANDQAYSALLARFDALLDEVADLRAVTAAGANAQVGATDRAARTFDSGFRDGRQRVRIGASAKAVA
ncbi:hypothetical protein [Oceanibaculum nanhaiense]|uniref:hypothetical protein n=1 Tax=Oceanibaculum nanhaiense TaxID=1909734 RepID=UPI003D2AC92F